MTQQRPATTILRVIPFKPQQPVGGAIIDAEGREVPITEHMISAPAANWKKASPAKP